MQTELLANIRIMVTRPIHQAQALCDMLTAHNGLAIKFPVIKIAPLALSKEMINAIKAIDTIDFAIFISPNAVEYGIAQLRAHAKIPDTLKLVTIGQASAKKMQQVLGRAADIYPTKQFNSEALLALDSLQSDQVKNKRVIIFRGCGGRELLAQSLRKRGADVAYIEVYQRIKPVIKRTYAETVFSAAAAPDIITVTSGEGLDNLVAMLRAADSDVLYHDRNSRQLYLERLWQTPLIVVTEKMRQQAQTQGFKNTIIVAAKASNEALLDSVIKWSKMKPID